jgi:hypothetical protein
MYEKMIQEYSDLKWVSQKRFKGWLEQYCKFYEFEYREGVDAMIGRYFEILNEQEIDLTPKQAEF